MMAVDWVGVARTALWCASLLGIGCDVDVYLGAVPRRDEGGLDGGTGAGLVAPVDDGAATASQPVDSADVLPDGRRPPTAILPGMSWQWQLADPVDAHQEADVFDIDLFDTPAADIQSLHDAGRTVLCFFSAGTRESFRSDAKQFEADTVGAVVSGAPRESWIDVRAASVRRLMAARLDLAVEQRCDGVQPSGVDGFDATGFGLTAADEIDYVQFLAGEAHRRGLSIGLTNAVELASAVEPSVDWALNQGCIQYRECDRLGPFVAAGKAVLHVELVADSSEGVTRQAEICDDAQRQAFSTIIKTQQLGAWRLACP